jgi:hypothetical protein
MLQSSQAFMAATFSSYRSLSGILTVVSTLWDKFPFCLGLRACHFPDGQSPNGQSPNGQSPNGHFLNSKPVFPAKTLGTSVVAIALGISLPWGSSLNALAQTSSFDDIRGHWSQLCVEKLAKRNQVSGFDDRLFYPERPLTRGLYADMLVRTFPDQPLERSSISFWDLSQSHPYFEAIQTAYRQGFFQGHGDSTFGPDQLVSREEFWVALTNGLDHSPILEVDATLRAAYDDADTISGYARGAVAAATERKFVVLPGLREFVPQGLISRAEAASALCQIQFQTAENTGVPPQFVVELPSLPDTVREIRTTETGGLMAELSYQKQNYTYREVQITLTRQGRVLVNQVIAIEGGFVRNLDLQIYDLEGDREPEVVFSVVAPGERCCSYSLIYSFFPQQQVYGATRHNWEYAGYQLLDLEQDGIPEFKSADTRFAFRFTDEYANSALPLQIWQFRQGQLFDVTQLYPKQVEDEAQELWDDYQRRQAQQLEIKGVLAAYVASKFLLGEGEEGFRQVTLEYVAGDRSRYFRELREFLRGTGYTNN